MYEHSFIKFWILVALCVISVFVRPSKAQCDDQVGCIDCFSHCVLLSSMCSDSVLKSFCRATCKSCPSESEVCNALNCDHNCITPSDGSAARCSCFQGYELDANERTCNDINECSNETICRNENSPICYNTPGDYICTACSALKGLWQYYRRNKCCKRRAKNFNQCGYSSTNGRIVRGRLARVARWPWMAYIKIGDELCGGSLLTTNWVLTAAHCVDSVTASQIRVVLGVVNASASGNIHEQTFQVVRIVVHPQFSMPNNDIALLRLHRSARLTRYVAKICLPNGHEPQEGEICHATGYGTTSFRGSISGSLQEVDLPIARNALCETTYANTTNRFNSVTHICAGYETGGKDTCQGDSGGPLLCQRCNNCDWYLAGITSFGRGCGRPGFYGAYTRVRHYETWIAGITGQRLEQSTCVRPSWHAWGPWTACSVECGGGTRRRVRSCQNGRAGDPDCIGGVSQSESCNTNRCSPDRLACQQWTTWSQSSCSETCGGGRMFSRRRCVRERENDEEEDDEEEERSLGECNQFACPTWESWGSWSSCSLSEGSCRRRSTRVCNRFGASILNCDGNASKTEPCDDVACLERAWSKYGEWGSCSQSCGGGQRSRRRVCLLGTVRTSGCPGSDTNTMECNRRICPSWSEYGQWSLCSVTCGMGEQRRTRVCSNGLPGQRGCEGSRYETQNCSQRDSCPSWGSWEAWSECSVTCGSGIRTSERFCYYQGILETGCEGDDLTVEICNTGLCPRWTIWGEWSACDKTCESGIQRRSRSCLFGNIGQPNCIGNQTEQRVCGTNCCPRWDDFGEFSECSETCNGTQVATRQCLCGTSSSVECEGSNTIERICNPEPCIRWGQFISISDCSVTCGGGQQSFTRNCINGNPGDVGCEGLTFETRLCNSQICPPEWSPWSEFSSCSSDCNGGEKSRTRVCMRGEPGTGNCIGVTNETESCNTHSCGVGQCSLLRNVFENNVCQGWVQLEWCTTFYQYMQINCIRACCEEGIILGDPFPAGQMAPVSRSVSIATTISPPCRDDLAHCLIWQCRFSTFSQVCRRTCGRCS